MMAGGSLSEVLDAAVDVGLSVVWRGIYGGVECNVVEGRRQKKGGRGDAGKE
jgi:hypothetical protein